MDFFLNIESTLDSINTKYDIASRRNDTICESFATEYTKNIKQASLKVMNESGTADDLSFLFEAADGNFKEKVLAAIENSWETIREWFHEMKMKVLVMLNKLAIKEKLAQLKSKIKFNPFARGKKVEVVDPEKAAKICESAIAECEKVMAKADAGKEVSSDDIDAVNEKLDKLGIDEIDKPGLPAPVASVIEKLEKGADNLAEKVSKIYDGKVKPFFKHVKDWVKSKGEKYGAPAVNTIKSLCRKVSDIAQKWASIIIKAITSGVQAVARALGDLKDKVTEKLAKESALDDIELNDITNESTGETTEENTDSFLEGMDDDKNLLESTGDPELDALFNETQETETTEETTQEATQESTEETTEQTTEQVAEESAENTDSLYADYGSKGSGGDADATNPDGQTHTDPKTPPTFEESVDEFIKEFLEGGEK